MKPGPGSQPRSRSAVKRDRRGYSRARFTHHHRPVQWWWRWWVVVCWWWWWWWWCGWYGLSTGRTVPGGTTGQAGRQLRLPHCLATTDCLYWLESTAWLCGDGSHYQRRPATLWSPGAGLSTPAQSCHWFNKPQASLYWPLSPWENQFTIRITTLLFLPLSLVYYFDARDEWKGHLNLSLFWVVRVWFGLVWSHSKIVLTRYGYSAVFLYFYKIYFVIHGLAEQSSATQKFRQ